jgi:UDPglucose--hexose-1-phosphate uridylyltransferase
MHEGRWEKRWHPLREEWIVYSAHRNSRPWQGASKITEKTSPEYDPACYLCPGNVRVGGIKNPDYADVFIFNNDHPVVGKDSPQIAASSDTLYRKSRAAGIAKVICYDRRHNITLAEMRLDEVVKVFHAFRAETTLLANDPDIHSILIFENKGEAVGVSNPHPHCQIYATDFPLKYVHGQIRIAGEYKKQSRENIYDAIIRRESRDGIRVIAENDSAIAFIPFFARYAYEMMIFPKQPHATLMSLPDHELHDLASVFHQTVRRLDMNYQMRFPYVMSVMQAPIDGKRYEDFRTHLWLQPPYRQPGLIKYLAGPEIGAGNFMADTMPEEKAAELRKIDVKQYSWER